MASICDETDVQLIPISDAPSPQKTVDERKQEELQNYTPTVIWSRH